MSSVFDRCFESFCETSVYQKCVGCVSLEGKYAHNLIIQKEINTIIISLYKKQ